MDDMTPEQWDAFETAVTAKLDQLTCDQLRAMYPGEAVTAQSARMLQEALPDLAAGELVRQQAATRVAGLIRIQLAERC
jgi:hypothetical protein